MKILISGATGFVGQELVKKLSYEHKLSLLVRSKDKATHQFSSLPENCRNNISYILWPSYYDEIDFSDSNHFDAAINLIGENIGAKKWSNQRKRDLYNSRIDATKTILSSLKKHQSSIATFISTSAIGIYSDGFLHKLSEAWERSAKENAKNFVNRVCILRLGMVIGEGGAMDKILPPFKLGLGGKLGSGKQIMSWIHLKDLVNIYSFTLTNKDLNSEINAVSKFPVTNAEFTNVLGKVLRKPTRFMIPSFMLRLIMGEQSSLVLDSIRVNPKKLKEHKFLYNYPTIEIALKDII